MLYPDPSNEFLVRAQDRLADFIKSADAAAAMFESLYTKYTKNPEKLAKAVKELLEAHGVDPDAPAAPRPVAPEASPAPTKKAIETPPVKLAAEQEQKPAARRRAPAILPDPGLTAVTDSMLPRLIGPAATAVWLCLLRHANGRAGRLVEKIGYREIGEGTGLSRWQVRAGLKILLELGIVQRTQDGRARDGEKLTAEYVVYFPTATRLERWLIAATKATKEGVL